MTKVKLTYFKSSGKFYDRAEYETDKEYPWEIYQEIRNWFQFHYFSSLPGRTSQHWDGYILVEPENEVPALVDMCER